VAEKNDRKSPHDVLRLVFRRRWLFVIGASAFAAGTMLGSHYLPLRYTATAIFERRSDMTEAELSRGRTESFESLKLTLNHELVGYNAIERMVEDLGLTGGMAHGPDGQLTLTGQTGKQQLIAGLQEAVDVTWDVRSDQVDLVRVSVTHSDPLLAQRIPNTLVRNYINHICEEIVRRLSHSRDFFRKQAANLDARVLELTKDKVDFEQKHIGMLPDNPGVLFEQIQRASADIDTVRRQNTLAKKKLARLRTLTQLASQPSAQPAAAVTVPNPELMVLRGLRRRAKEDLYRLQAINLMTDKHPRVVALKRMIADYEKQIEETPAEMALDGEDLVSPGDRGAAIRMADLEAEVEMTDSELERLDARLAGYHALIREFGPIHQQYMQLVKKLTDAQDELKTWQQGLRKVDMQLAAEVAKRRTHLNAVQTARQPLRPSFPSLLLVMGLAGGGGIAFGCGLIFLANSLDRTIATTEEAARHFGVPIHGVIGEILTPYQKLARRWKRRILGPATALALAAALGLSTLSIVLFLQSPETYKHWRASPPRFVHQKITEITKGLLRRI